MFIDESKLFKGNMCGILNLGSNCYLNSGLQIIASCNKLICELNKIDNPQKIITYIKEAIKVLLEEVIYNPKDFIEYFCKKNSDFIIGNPGCSQNFIRTLIRNMNSECLNTKFELINKNNQYYPTDKEKDEYENFIVSNKIYPESQLQSIFSCMTKSYSNVKCKNCDKNVYNYSFSYSLDLNLYLDAFHQIKKCKFSDVLKSNMGTTYLSMDCPYCHNEIISKEITKFIKLPDILIFTLERYQGKTNNIEIFPEPILNMSDFIDDNLKADCINYELFAINIRIGKNANNGHEICQVKRGTNWYEFNDKYGQTINQTSYYDSSYGLFYRKINKSLKHLQNKKDENFEDIPRTRITNLEVNKKTNESNCCFGSIQLNHKNKNNNKNNFFRIKNYGHKELNSALEIMSLFDGLKDELKKYTSKYNIKSNFLSNLLKDAIDKLSKNNNYDAYNLTIFKFKEPLRNSQNFIIKSIIKINEEFTQLDQNINNSPSYNNNSSSISNTEIYNDYKTIERELNLKTKAFNIFSIISKTHSLEKCCKKEEQSYYKYNIEIIINLENTNKNNCNFSDFLSENFNIKIKNICSLCNKEIIKNEVISIFRIPKILIFTFINNKGINIKPDDTIDMKKYIDSSLIENNTLYKLFAINMWNKDFDDCIVKREKKWVKINENEIKPIEELNFLKNICGLFYKKI